MQVYRLYYNITENFAILSDIGYKFPQEILNLILNSIAPEDIINIIKMLIWKIFLMMY
ncbi:hypothetical protein Rh054_03490 [Rickettsia conorii subsp. heilongjiangensis 054]|nr:hypothetical protein Rh054_03490 [Rickettsia conorii subsp. heilongjiangensis 054]